MKKLTKREINMLANVKSVTDTCATDPLFYFHTFSENGRIKNQGYVHALTENGSGKATLFSFMTGYKTDTFVFGPLFLSGIAVYGSDYEMKEAYEKHEAARKNA